MYITNDRSDLILSLIDKKFNINTVVDLGCYDEATLLGLKNSKVLNAKHYYGVDYKIASSMSNNETISFYNCDLNGNLSKIKMILEKADLILLLDVLEHLYEPEVFLEKLVNIIKPKSTLIITVPNASSIRMLYAWFKKDFPRNELGYFDRTHRSWFTLKSLLKITLLKLHSKKLGYVYSKKPLIKYSQK